ncbi:MAG: hypothetical protein HKN07_16080 [Acidimicrobiia bacterium]|nr:hypothetical protein [Acidimicrobiia bacterium]NNF65764.1 hypothetical protein [Acidimicrobiia bacterium]
MTAGWIIGYGIGALVVVIVAVLVITLIIQARKVGDQFIDIRNALDAAQHNTEGLWAVSGANRSLEGVVASAITLRKVVEGGDG